MRYRSTNSETVSTANRHGRSSCSGSYNTTPSYQTVGRRKEIWDCLTPDYFKRLARGGVLPYLPVTIKTQNIEATPLSFTGQKLTGTGAPCQDRYGSRYFDDSYWNPLSVMNEPDPAKIAYVVNAAIASAKSEAWDALTSFAELGKSVSMISSRVHSVFNYADKANRRASRERTFRKQRETFDSAWLEMRYGWRPLLFEIEDICEQVTKRKYTYNRSHSSVEEVIDGSSTPKTTTSSLDIWTGTSVRSGTRTYRGFALAVGDFGHAPEFRPAQTAWELVPFSFVVDWFFDVGSFISAITPIPGVDIRASGYSVREEYTITQTLSGATNPSQSTNSLSVTANEVKTTEVQQYSRTPSSTLYPTFYPRLNHLKLIDIAAIVFQRATPLSRFLTKR